MGQNFKNIIGRDFKADGPWQRLGTDVTEFKLSFGKAYLATYITRWNTTRRHVKLTGLTRQNTGIRPYGKPHNGYPFKASKFRGAVHRSVAARGLSSDGISSSTKSSSLLRRYLQR